MPQNKFVLDNVHSQGVYESNFKNKSILTATKGVVDRFKTIIEA